MSPSQSDKTDKSSHMRSKTPNGSNSSNGRPGKSKTAASASSAVSCSAVAAGEHSLASVETLDRDNEMKRGLNSRHIQFIALGGTIGTGLFLGSGKSIALTGPSIALVYLTIGIFMFILLRAIGEMMYYDPSQHSFINFIGKYLGTTWGRFCGWTYWFVVMFVAMTEATAIGTYCISFFKTFDIDVTDCKFFIEIGFLVLFACVNLIAVKLFGEAEFWFGMIKISLIVGMILTAIVMLVIQFSYPAHYVEAADEYIEAGKVSLSNIFDGFSLAPNGFMALLLSFPMAFFAYTSIEFVGVAASEAEEPRKNIPKAINQIVYRVLIFYVGSLIAITAIVPWRNFKEKAGGGFQSPFIMVFEYAGIKWAAMLVFFVVVTAAASAINSLLYSAGRQLYQQAELARNPALKYFAKVSDRKVPARAIIASACVISISPICSLMPQMKTAFILFSSAASTVILFVYSFTILAHMKYRKSADFASDGFKMPAYKILDPICLAFFIFMYITLLIGEETRIVALVGLTWFGVFSTVCYFIYERKQKVNPDPTSIGK